MVITQHVFITIKAAQTNGFDPSGWMVNHNKWTLKTVLSFKEPNVEWNTVKSYTPNCLQSRDFLRCGADDLCRPQNSQTQSQLLWHAHNTSLFVFAWPAAEHRLCPPLRAATTEMDVTVKYAYPSCTIIKMSTAHCVQNWPTGPQFDAKERDLTNTR